MALAGFSPANFAHMRFNKGEGDMTDHSDGFSTTILPNPDEGQASRPFSWFTIIMLLVSVVAVGIGLLFLKCKQYRIKQERMRRARVRAVLGRTPLVSILSGNANDDADVAIGTDTTDAERNV